MLEFEIHAHITSMAFNIKSFKPVLTKESCIQNVNITLVIFQLLSLNVKQTHIMLKMDNVLMVLDQIQHEKWKLNIHLSECKRYTSISSMGASVL
jgi:hypothetical protein